MPTVSILIPNYNHSTHLHQSLGGACGQTRLADEILVCDDGSRDDSVRIVEEFAARYPQLRLLRNEQNRGMQYTINRLLRESRGDYIVCAAADDELYPRFLERHIERLAKYPEAGMSVSEFMVLTTSGRVINQSRNMPQSFGLEGLPEYLSPSDLSRIFSERYLWMTSNAIVARRDAVLRVGGFIKEQEWHSDWFTYYAVGLREGVCPIPEGLGVIRENPGGYSDTGMKDFARQKPVLQAIIAAACRPPNDDLRKIFRECPAVLSVFGVQLAKVLARQPQHWDIAIPYVIFMLKRYKKNSGRSWPRLLHYAIKKALV